MKNNFNFALEHLAESEGGYVNHPRDPGGATNKGVIQRVYNAYRSRKGQPTRSVRRITDSEVADIYKTMYWDKVEGDTLPSGLDYCVFDFAVNSGPRRSVRYLQWALNRIEGRNLAKDGIVGPATLQAVESAQDIHGVIKFICNKRKSFLRRLGHWKTFRRGWTRRVKKVRRLSLSMASQASRTPTPTPESKHGPVGDKKKNKGILDWITGIFTSIGVGILNAVNNPYAMAVVLFGIGVLGFFLYRKYYASNDFKLGAKISKLWRSGTNSWFSKGKRAN